MFYIYIMRLKWEYYSNIWDTLMFKQNVLQISLISDIYCEKYFNHIFIYEIIHKILKNIINA